MAGDPWALMRAHRKLTTEEIDACWAGWQETTGSDLPPPSQWRKLRTAAGLSCTDMETITGFPQMSIRRWEEGAGTLTPEAWPEYARALVQEVARVRDTQRARTGISVTDPVSAAQIRDLQGLLAGLDLYLQREPEASAGDLRQVAKVLRQAARQLRAAEIRVLGYMQHKEGNGRDRI